MKPFARFEVQLRSWDGGLPEPVYRYTVYAITRRKSYVPIDHSGWQEAPREAFRWLEKRYPRIAAEWPQARAYSGDKR